MRLSALAERLGLVAEGDGELEITAAASLDTAGPGELSFVSSARWAERLPDSKAGAVVLPPGVDAGGRPTLRSERPRRDFARAVALLHPPLRLPPGIDSSAAVAVDARVHAEASVGARAVVGAACSVGPRSAIHPGAVLYPNVEVGADCEIHAGCVLREGTRLGDRVILQPGVLLGGDGFGFEPGEDGEWEKVPQLGRVVVEDDVEIGAGSTVDRASLGETRIRRGAKLDNLVMVAHNCDIGEDAIVVAQSGLSGGTRIGRRAILMARTGTVGHLEVGEGAFVGARSSVARSVPAGARVFGTPAVAERTWHKAMAALWRLPDALRRLRRLEKRVERLDGEGGDA
jgi:UDP-3-O-[3-hydroxymyristoyl] glucosamine N-acyltransferase